MDQLGGLTLFVVLSLVAARGYRVTWLSGTATWYGEKEGDGSDGGACGYKSWVHERPYKGRVTAVNDAIFQNGTGCGECYKVKCCDPSICGKRPVTVIVADQCPPGGACSDRLYHFDLSGAAYGRMAVSRYRAGELRNRGEVPIHIRRTRCLFRKKNIYFGVNEGSTNYWLSLIVLFENGDGDVGSMEIKQANSDTWQNMRQVWGGTWCINGGPLVGPFSIQLRSRGTNGKPLVAVDVIPENWTSRVIYQSTVNF